MGNTLQKWVVTLGQIGHTLKKVTLRNIGHNWQKGSQTAI